ncbi:Putative major facilitator superfamily, MFS transporter superfamily [Colletotrichum destructivum]|uniref:Major facilitator superfamily, MFS transporter superfamily n=1 Tax=Colletotrichum destructivum TaxID=34406 RepID=A0AAX4J2A6_9PEZI|nr:Putative major facilitator superfamily, MFS transporter superfamily [Colletotrichum destructivum]
MLVLRSSGPQRAASRNDADDEVSEGYPKLSKSRSILLTAVISTVGLLTVRAQRTVSCDHATFYVGRGRYPACVPANGRLHLQHLNGQPDADVYGRRLVYLLRSILFTISNLCLPFTRGAALIPSGIGIIASTFPRGKARNNAYVCISAVASVGSVLGNIFGGVIGGLLSWQWVFWIAAIMAGVTTAIAYFITGTPHLRSSPSASTSAENGGDETRTRSVDWTGGALVSCSLALLLAAFTQANLIGWSTTWIPPLIAASVVLLVGFCFWQRRLEKDPAREPLLRISRFKNLQFSALFVYQGCLALSELDTTLRFLPAGIAGLLIPFVVYPALSRIHAFDILAFGLTSYWAYGFPAMCLCFSIEIVWPVISLLIAASFPSADQVLGSGLLQSSNNVGRALGLAVANAIQTSAQRPEMAVGGFAGLPGFLYGVRAAQWTNVGFAIAALGIAFAFFRDLGCV